MRVLLPSSPLPPLLHHTQDFKLASLDLQLRRGELVAVVGPVASGKSSLLSALLGDLQGDAEECDIVRRGRVAYVAQSHWIQPVLYIGLLLSVYTSVCSIY